VNVAAAPWRIARAQSRSLIYAAAMSSPTAATSPRAVRLTITCTLLLLAVPVLVDLAVGGLRRAFDYTASDSYYYLAVARNIVDKGRVSFDGELATNGFHPVWQFLLAGIFGVVRLCHVDQSAMMFLSLLAGLALIGGGLYWLGRALAATGTLTPLFATLPFGAYGLLVLPAWIKDARLEMAVQGPLWAYVNGMESGALLFFWGASAFWYVTRPVLTRRRDAAVLGLLLALVVLSRLDFVFMPAALLGALLVQTFASRDREANICALTAALACSVPIAIYCAINRIGFGTLFPVSGAIKSTFPHIHQYNIARLVTSLLHPAQQAWYRLYRLAQLFIPGVVAILCLVVELRPQRRLPWLRLRAGAGRLEAYLCASAVGVLAVSLYDLCFVELSDQGTWYTPVGTLFTSLYLVLLVARARPLRRLEGSARYIVLGAVVAVGITYFVRYEHVVGAGAAWANFYIDEAPRVKKFYAGQNPRFLEVDDGIFTFATGFPAMAGKGFVLDMEGVRALMHGAIVPLSVARGFNRITSVLYMNVAGLGPGAPPQVACGKVSGVTPPQLCHRYRFSIEYAHGAFGVIRVDPL
jgi:hypothetical protein